MMRAFITWCILAVASPAAQGGNATDSNTLGEGVPLLTYGFEEQNDLDFDEWPDGWRRESGPGYPSYVKIAIVEDDHAAEGLQSLGVTLNGGAASIISPVIDKEIGANFSYKLEVAARAEGLRNDVVGVSLTFLDAQGKQLQTVQSRQVTNASKWTTLEVGPVNPDSIQARKIVVGLHVIPGLRPDIHGKVWFDDVRLTRSPRINIRMDRLSRLYTTGDKVSVMCELSGVVQKDPTVTFEVVDHEGRKITSDPKPLKERTSDGHPTVVGHAAALSEEGFSGTTVWETGLTEPGFYRVSARVDGMGRDNEVYFAVLDNKTSSKGEFGWTLRQVDNELLPVLAHLLPRMGIGWVKYPVWVDAKDTKRLDDLVTFAERLGRAGLESVAILCDPPHVAGNSIVDPGQEHIADVFAQPAATWYPAVLPVVSQLSLQVRYWQLGRDEDISFVGLPNMVKTVEDVKKELKSFGQELYVGLAWPVIEDTPKPQKIPWDFLALWANPPLTAQELSTCLAHDNSSEERRWVNVNPLMRGVYPDKVRINDLVLRMMEAKIQGANGIFVNDPLSAHAGLLNEDGSPSELMLPWRTMALALSGATYIGELALENGSENRLFLRDGKVTMVIWNDHPVKERVYLGEKVEQSDLWGRKKETNYDAHTPVFEIGTTPTLISNVNESIVRWNMAVEFETVQIPSYFGKLYKNALRVKNTFPQGVYGAVNLGLDKSWKAVPQIQDFKLALGESLRIPFEFTLPLDADSGPKAIKIDFVQLTADRPYAFSVYRHLDIGLDDVKIEVTTHLNEKDELEVVQKIINMERDRISFRCVLYAPNRPRLVCQVVKLGQDEDVKTYVFPRGKDLVGEQLRIKAEEIDGPRVLNKKFEAVE